MSFACCRRPLGVFPILIGILGTTLLGGCGAPSGDLAGSNLLLITVDTLRADRLGAYGYRQIETPAVDRLAAEGVRFARVISPSPTTLPAHASIFTGATPPRHGIRDNAEGVLRQSAVTLAEAFQQADYRTGAFVGAFVLDPRAGLSQGFDVYSGPPVAPGAAPTGLTESERRGKEVLEDALPWIRNQGRNRWFAWVHLFDPHAPYWPPPPYDRTYADRPYDGEIAYVDSLIAEFRSGLEESGVWAETTVLFTADHGEALGEHGEPAHGFFLYDGTLRVPLILRPADGAAVSYGRGEVIERAVGLIDLFPTLAELYGLALPEELEGRSLAAALRGEEIPELPVYSETILPRLYFGWHDLRAITEGQYKFIEAPTPELYDLEVDSAEENNLAEDLPGQVNRLRAALTDWPQRADLSDQGDAAVDPERLATLRSLGYLAVGGTASDSANLADPKDKIEVYQSLMLALGAWREGYVEDALELIDGEIDRDPDFAGAQHFRGLVLSSSGRFEEATEAFRRAVEIDPGHAVAVRELARAHRTLGQFEEAAAALGELLATEPRNSALRWELGGIYLEGGDAAAAARVFGEGVSADPEAAPMHFGLGLVALQRGNPDAALNSLDRAAELAPQLNNLHYQRGVILEMLQRPQEAIAAYTAETSHQPRHYVAQMSRARLLAQHGAPYEEVIASLRAALVTRPDAPEAMLFLAQALLETGVATRLGEAERLAEGGLAAINDSPRLTRLKVLGHLTLAQIYEAQGREQAARLQRATAEQLSASGQFP